MRSLFEISQSGLKSAERSLSVTSNNIINADTEGYSRQRIDKTPVATDMGGYHTGLGVNISSIKRLRNEMTDVQLNQKRQDLSFMLSKSLVYEQLEANMVSDSGNDLDMSISNILNAFSDLSTDPQDMSVRNSLISEAQQLSDKFSDISSNINRTSELTKESANLTINEINNLLKEIHVLNSSITKSAGAGVADSSSLDMRVRKLNELSNLIDFEVNEVEFGAIELRIGGVKILDNNEASSLKAEINDTTKTFNLRLESGKKIAISGGKLGGEIGMYEEEIPAIKERLDLLASTIVKEFNGIHFKGFGLVDGSQRNFFDPNFTTAEEIRLNVDILTNPSHIAAATISGEAGNGELALELANIRDKGVIEGRKLVDYSIDLITSPGVKLSGLNNRMEARGAEINMLEAQQEREAGVNVDEELSLMIQYQNAYQSAARVMEMAQKMYDTLINIL